MHQTCLLLILAHNFTASIIMVVSNTISARAQDGGGEWLTLSIIDGLPFPAALYTGREMRISFANRATLNIWGKGDGVIGKLYKQVHPELEKQGIFHQLDSVFNTGETFHAENQQIELVSGGKKFTFYFNYTFKPIIAPDGKVFGILSTATDVTEYNLVKQRLLQSEENFRTMIAGAPVAICILQGANFVVEIANIRMLALWNRPAGEVLGKPFFEALPHTAALPAMQQILEEVYHTGKTIEVNEYAVSAAASDGHEPLYQNVVYQPFRDTAGLILGVVVVSADVTKHVLARNNFEHTIEERTEELVQYYGKYRISEERYHHMIDEVEDYAIILLDKNGIIQNWNKGAEKIKGYREDEIVGKSFEMFYLDEDRRRGLPRMLITEAETKGKAQSEGWRKRKGDSKFWGSIVITALHDSTGAVTGFSKVTRDLTERKMAEDKLKAYSQELEFQNKELEQFAYAASHDLKEPLRKIQYYTTFLNDALNTVMDQKQQKYMQRVLNATQKMSTLIDNILSYSKTAADPKHPEPVDLNSIIEEVKNGILEDVSMHDINITYEHLPVIEGTAFQWNQLFTNLVNNAIKYRKPGQRSSINITYNLLDGADVPVETVIGPFHQISVADNGVGFDMQYASKIFDIFQRLDNTRGTSGAGIGLAICKRIVQNHNGYISATGAVNEGARFDIYIPAVIGR